MPPLVHEAPNCLIVGQRIFTTEPLSTQSSPKLGELKGEPQARRWLLNHGTKSTSANERQSGNMIATGLW
jgi:hypothetical protein